MPITRATKSIYIEFTFVFKKCEAGRIFLTLVTSDHADHGLIFIPQGDWTEYQIYLTDETSNTYFALFVQIRHRKDLKWCQTDRDGHW